MDELLQKYFDGELTATEASEFNQALARNPELDAELKAVERALGVLASPPAPHRPSLSFNDDVMRRVAARAASIQPPPRLSRPRRARTWSLRLAWSAACVFAFVLGHIARGDRTPAAPERVALTAPGPESSYAGPGLRVARLVYVPRNDGVERVSVAGTFNGWSPDLTQMDRVGDVWVIVITLPPDSYEYMFVEDGSRWVTDPLAVQTRDDGFGRKNAVLDLSM